MKTNDFDRGAPGLFPVPVIPALVAAALSAVALLVAALSAILLVACSSPVSEEFYDAGVLPDDYFRMELPAAGSGGGIRIIVSPDFGESREFRPFGSESVLLEFRKNRPAAVLAYLPGNEKPSGAIYPYTEELDGRDGFAAEILWELYNEGGCLTESEKENVRLFNWHKLIEAMREQDNSWLIDSDKVKAAILSGKFTKSKIKKWVKKPS